MQHHRKVRGGFLLDTDIISHLSNKKAPHSGVVDFFAQVDEDEIHLSVVTLGEIQKGIDLLRGTGGEVSLQRKILLEQRLEACLERFTGRIILINAKIARTWGELQAYSQLRGFQSSAMDTLIAASAYTTNLVIVSGDADFKVFADCISIYNPFEEVHPS